MGTLRVATLGDTYMEPATTKRPSWRWAATAHRAMTKTVAATAAMPIGAAGVFSLVCTAVSRFTAGGTPGPGAGPMPGRPWGIPRHRPRHGPRHRRRWCPGGWGTPGRE